MNELKIGDLVTTVKPIDELRLSHWNRDFKNNDRMNALIKAQVETGVWRVTAQYNSIVRFTHESGLSYGWESFDFKRLDPIDILLRVLETLPS